MVPGDGCGTIDALVFSLTTQQAALKRSELTRHMVGMGGLYSPYFHFDMTLVFEVHPRLA